MDAMGDRLKNYEALGENVLIPRMPVILRLDGNSFSKFTRQYKFAKPRDLRFEAAMNAAAKAVLEYCSGAQVAYTQSDEITILLRNDQTHNTDPFLNNRTQKLASLCASKASVAFNRALADPTIMGFAMKDADAVFDCRAFVVPPSEVNNVFLWRQHDAFKNAVQGFAYWKIGAEIGRKTTQRMMHGLNTNQLQELIFQKLGINFNDLPTAFKRGRAISKVKEEKLLRSVMEYVEFDRLLQAGKVTEDQKVVRSRWKVDMEIPRFDEDRNYIGKFMEAPCE